MKTIKFYALLILALWIAISPLPAQSDDQAEAEGFYRELVSMIKPDGFGNIQFGDSRHEVWKKTILHPHYSHPCSRIWDQIPSNGITLASQSCMVYWGFDPDILNRIVIHFPPYADLSSSQGRVFKNRNLAKDSLQKAYGPPTQTENIDICDISPGSGLSIERWRFPTGTEIRISIFRHEPFPRIYSVAIEMVDLTRSAKGR